ncbi:peptidyl-prolyl cis-trans isomerase FKBP18, chloroplastic isoform X3 [Setaria italica]|uniref:peptidyl-prolyl cis-trans isomerase FKBP18, chloroplastic isoform X3 n=1 Tax=Setaria italica TaxID=4555 RepID=UPI0003512BB5|nr:peptidyl-prolyl cis-trans isomerase FKBP18, chloroplastic isoform X3 [Setaria italica]XP_034583646.1 peptidyl-prolyl cis-trans isomerase FKBP18, chloroplastic isoform X3 [Setaria viridis]
MDMMVMMTWQLCARHFGPSNHSAMAASALPSRTFHRLRLPSSATSHPSRETCLPSAVSRRRAAVQLLSAGFLTAVSPPPPSLAARRGRIVVPPEDYLTAPADGLKYYDLIEGKGPTAEKGSAVQVHFDCIYRGITAVSSRESKLLAGNRSIAQPYEFIVGSPPGKERKRDFTDNANGLYSAQAAPKPPAAMYTITEGMKVGGKRRVIVPPELGYGKRGMSEIPGPKRRNVNT